MENSQKRTCIFCGGTGLSREHILADWISNYFPKKTKGTVVIDKSGSIIKQFTSPIFQQTLEGVCTKCNGGWMSTLEAEAKNILGPMLFDMKYSCTLNESQQAILCYWAQKTALVFSLSTSAEYKIPRQHFDEMYYAKSAIRSIRVQIGWRLPKKSSIGPHLAHFTLSKIDGPILEKMKLPDGEVWRAILVIGNVVFHLTGSSGGLEAEVENSDPRVTPSLNPYTNDIMWPVEWPVDALTSVGYTEFADI